MTKKVFNLRIKILTITVIGLIWLGDVANADDPNRLPTKCEICKYLTAEIAENLNKYNSHELIETAYSLDERLSKKKSKKYRDSEVRLIEVVENVCENILDYNVHAERSGSLRYSKGESQTMGTLKGLVNRGVKVELGIPYDLWDTPSAEITQLKKYCDTWAEVYEEHIEQWYKTERDNTTLTEYLCDRYILKEEEKVCLNEVFVPTKEEATTVKTPLSPPKEPEEEKKRLILVDDEEDEDEDEQGNKKSEKDDAKPTKPPTTKKEEGESELEKRKRREMKKREWDRQREKMNRDRRNRDRDRRRDDEERERERQRIRERIEKERREKKRKGIPDDEL